MPISHFFVIIGPTFIWNQAATTNTTTTTNTALSESNDYQQTATTTTLNLAFSSQSSPRTSTSSLSSCNYPELKDIGMIIDEEDDIVQVTSSSNNKNKNNANPKKPSAHRQAFYKLFQDPTSYTSFKLFASKSYCSELTTFVDEYQYIKARLIQSFEPQSIITGDDNNSKGQEDTAKQFSQSSYSFKSTGSLIRKLSQKKIHFLPLISNTLSQSTTNVNKPNSNSNNNNNEESLLYTNLTPINQGLLETLIQKYPSLNITSQNTPIPSEIQSLLFSFVRNYILPDSSFAVNITSGSIKFAKSCLENGIAEWDMLDQARDEILNLLYQNVYPRYLKELQFGENYCSSTVSFSTPALVIPPPPPHYSASLASLNNHHHHPS